MDSSVEVKQDIRGLANINRVGHLGRGKSGALTPRLLRRNESRPLASGGW